MAENKLKDSPSEGFNKPDRHPLYGTSDRGIFIPEGFKEIVETPSLQSDKQLHLLK